MKAEGKRKRIEMNAGKKDDEFWREAPMYGK